MISQGCLTILYENNCLGQLGTCEYLCPTDTNNDPFSCTNFWLGSHITAFLKQCVKATKEVKNWYPLGVQLGIETCNLKEIERNHGGDVERCKIEAIDHWLHNDPEPTWNKFVQALEDVGGHAKIVQTMKANHEGW